jgi:hypothetical protein
MSGGRPLGARLAMWWVRAYTATAPPADAADRRAEVAADVEDELRAAGERASRAVVSRRIVSRVLRGVAADVLWRLAIERGSGRAAWHLAHPAVFIGALTALLVPLVLVGDVLRSQSRGNAGRLLDLVHTGIVLLSAAILAVAVTASMRRLVDRAGDRRERGVLVLARRCTGLGVCVLGAASALWRFTPGPWERLAAVSWAAFAACLLAWLILAVVVSAGGARRRRARSH